MSVLDLLFKIGLGWAVEWFRNAASKTRAAVTDSRAESAYELQLRQVRSAEHERGAELLVAAWVEQVIAQNTSAWEAAPHLLRMFPTLKGDIEIKGEAERVAAQMALRVNQAVKTVTPPLPKVGGTIRLEVHNPTFNGGRRGLVVKRRD